MQNDSQHLQGLLMNCWVRSVGLSEIRSPFLPCIGDHNTRITIQMLGLRSRQNLIFIQAHVNEPDVRQAKAARFFC